MKQGKRRIDYHIVQIGTNKVWTELSIGVQVAADKVIDVHRGIAKIEQRTKASLVIDQHPNKKYSQHAKEAPPENTPCGRQVPLTLSPPGKKGREGQHDKKWESQESDAAGKCRQSQVDASHDWSLLAQCLAGVKEQERRSHNVCNIPDVSL